MKRFLTLSLAAMMLVTALVGCTSQPPKESATPAPEKTPEERTEAYQTAITGTRSQDENDAYGIVTSPDDDLADLIFQTLGLAADDMTAYAISISPMNTKAYGIAAIMPAAGKEDLVLEGVNKFVELQKQNFEGYLPDQKEIANAAKVETMDDGTILLVMCAAQDDVLASMKEALK